MTPERNSRVPITWVVQIIGWTVAMLMAYGMTRVDIAALQVKQGETDRRLERIEMKLDQLLSRP